MTEPAKEPLWVLALMAGDSTPGRPRDAFAAELRVIADWLVPEESSEPFLPGEDSHNRSKRQQRRHLRRILLEEATKAEASE